MHESARYVPCFSVKGEKIKERHGYRMGLRFYFGASGAGKSTQLHNERYADVLRGDTIAF